MIALDTNVLLRWIVQDDAKQLIVSEEIFERAIKLGEEIHLSDIVLCELVWNLERGYRFEKRQIVDALVRIYRSAHVHLNSSERVERAIGLYRKGRGDFADYLIREEAKDEGCRKLFSFDKALLKSSNFVSDNPDDF